MIPMIWDMGRSGDDTFDCCILQREPSGIYKLSYTSQQRNDAATPRFVVPAPDGVLLKVFAIPSSSSCDLAVHEDVLDVEVDQPAKKGAANEAICLFLASVFGVKRSDVSIISGGKERNKVISILGVSAEYVAEKVHKTSQSHPAQASD